MQKNRELSVPSKPFRIIQERRRRRKIRKRIALAATAAVIIILLVFCGFNKRSVDGAAPPETETETETKHRISLEDLNLEAKVEAVLIKGQTTESEEEQPESEEEQPESEEEQPESEEEQPESEERLWTDEEAYLLAKIAMAEAEGEDTKGKALVILTVLNRVQSNLFPDTIEKVIFEKNQFAPIKDGRFYRVEPNEDCWAALALIENGWDESQGALYFRTTVAEETWHSRNLKELFACGNHTFYTEVNAE